MDDKLKLGNSGQAQKPMEPHYLIETEDGNLVNVPESSLGSWQEGQRNGEDYRSAVRQLAAQIAAEVDEYFKPTQADTASETPEK